MTLMVAPPPAYLCAPVVSNAADTDVVGEFSRSRKRKPPKGGLITNQKINDSVQSIP